MLHAQPPLVQRLVDPLLFPREVLAPGCLRRHEDVDLRQRKRQEAEILQQLTPRGQGIRRRVGKALVMDAASSRLAEKSERVPVKPCAWISRHKRD